MRDKIINIEASNFEIDYSSVFSLALTCHVNIIRESGAVSDYTFKEFINIETATLYSGSDSIKYCENDFTNSCSSLEIFRIWRHIADKFYLPFKLDLLEVCRKLSLNWYYLNHKDFGLYFRLTSELRIMHSHEATKRDFLLIDLSKFEEINLYYSSRSLIEDKYIDQDAIIEQVKSNHHIDLSFYN